MGEQQRVEILKMLFTGAKLLILDEPTSVLSPQEIEELFASLRQMADDGKAVLFITHKLEEVMRFSDRITVMRDGKQMEPILTIHANKADLVRSMLRRECRRTVKKTARSSYEQSVLRMENVSVKNDRGQVALNDVTLTINEGEILGVAGVAGNGQRELVEAIAGLRRISNGKIEVNGKDVANASPRHSIRAGTGYVPEDRVGVGLVTSMNAYENAILRDYGCPPIAKRGILRNKKIRERTESFIRERNIKCNKPNLPVGLMSGGNLQKLLVAREVNAKPKLLLAAYPTHGLDVGATIDIHDILVAQRNNGVAILLISEDLDELFELSDKITALHAGNLMGIFPAHEVDCDYIGGLMLGMAKEEQKGCDRDEVETSI